MARLGAANRTNLLRCIAMALVLIAQPALAQMPCGLHAAIAQRLTQRFGEARIGGGFVSAHRVVELWVAPHGTSWTLLSVTPSGVACIIAVGRGWRSHEAPAPGTPSSLPIPRGGVNPDPDARAGPPPRLGPSRPDFLSGRGGASSLSRVTVPAGATSARPEAGLACPPVRPVFAAPPCRGGL